MDVLDIVIKEEFDPDVISGSQLYTVDGIKEENVVDIEINERNLDEEEKSDGTEDQKEVSALPRSSDIDRLIDDNVGTNSVDTAFRCKVCSRSFKTRLILASHKRVHLGAKDNQCPICFKNFKQKGNLENHLRTHTGEKPFHCTICSQSFSDKRILTNHASKHTGAKPYHCESCDNYYTDLNSLLRHKAGFHR